MEGASVQPSQTYQQDVDVSSDAAPVLQDLLHPSQQHAENGLLDVLMSMDAGSQGSGQLVKDILKQKRQSVACHVGWSNQEQAILQKTISARISAYSYHRATWMKINWKGEDCWPEFSFSGIYMNSWTILSLSPKQALEAVRARLAPLCATEESSERKRLGQNPIISVWGEKRGVSPAEEIPWKPAGRIRTQQSCQQEGCSASSTEAAKKPTGPDHSLSRKCKENELENPTVC